MNIRKLFAGVALSLCAVMPARAQMTRSQLETDINDFIHANGTGAISGPILNGRLINIAESIATTVDANTFSQIQSFLGGASFGGQVSVIQALGAVTASGVGVASQTSSLTGPAFYVDIGGPSLYDVLDGVGILAPGSTVWQMDGVAGIIRDQVAQSGGGQNGVAIFGLATCEVDGCNVWGINTDTNDAYPYVLGTGAGRGMGNEYDFNASQTGTTVGGSSVGGGSIAQPTEAFGYAVNTLGNGITWDVGFWSLSGTTSEGLVLGAKAASGANIASQEIHLGWFDGSSDAQTTIINMVDGYLELQATSAWNGIVIEEGNLTFSASQAILFDGYDAITSDASGNLTVGNGSTILQLNGATGVLPKTTGTTALGGASNEWGNIYTLALTFTTLPSGTPATYACFTSTKTLVSSASAC